MKAPRNASPVCKMVLGAMPEAISLFVWRIGDGRTMRFLEDNWLGVLPLSCWPTFINMNTHWLAKVAECLLPGRNWNWDVISAWADGELQDRISHLPRALRSSQDVLLLSLTEKPRAASGQIYSSIVCNARKGGNGSRSLEEFRGIWKLKVTPRVCVFMWRVAGDHLPSAVWLARRKLCNSPSCQQGCTEDESLQHIFWRCPRAQEVWADRTCSGSVDQLGPVNRGRSTVH
ncbi:hypothetical protein HPP92_006352 [Vanilla planifolia]|uniref:Reverse transcriptase zinc-binding domain-containing protein n=1 Tax=Vanilla planifolia TaxID=51239 RepID=A0A835V9X8_VANPL|nr:hypothetical protein HPP92_006352 [Vanilla planifolia]